MRELVLGALELLWPRACAVCRTPAPELLCPGCARALPWTEPDACGLCELRPRTSDSPRCAACARRRRPLAACVAGVRFEGDAAQWIKRFKYASPWQPAFGAVERARIRALVRASAARMPDEQPDALVPIPLHRRRLQRRGFNPAQVVARELAREVGAPLRHALRRTRDTPSQTGLDRAARRRNLAGAFATRGAVTPHVWLVDDVVTTGATLEAAARALRRAGARRVVGVCLARTPRERASGAR